MMWRPASTVWLHASAASHSQLALHGTAAHPPSRHANEGEQSEDVSHCSGATGWPWPLLRSSTQAPRWQAWCRAQSSAFCVVHRGGRARGSLSRRRHREWLRIGHAANADRAARSRRLRRLLPSHHTEGGKIVVKAVQALRRSSFTSSRAAATLITKQLSSARGRGDHAGARFGARVGRSTLLGRPHRGRNTVRRRRRARISKGGRAQRRRAALCPRARGVQPRPRNERARAGASARRSEAGSERISRFEDDPRALSFIAEYYADVGTPARGLPYVLRAVHGDSACYRCLDTLARLRFVMDAPKDAVAMERRAIALFPPEQSPRAFLARLAVYEVVAALPETQTASARPTLPPSTTPIEQDDPPSETSETPPD